jgi:Holliday junction resolvase RusA-like endonuclease
MSEWNHYDFGVVPKPRMTRADKWKKRKCVVKYRDFKDRCREARVEIPESLEVMFLIPMPPSWSNKKAAEMNGEPHQQKPDVDNLVKGLLDTLAEDSNIWRVNAAKYWSIDPSFSIREIL